MSKKYTVSASVLESYLSTALWSSTTYDEQGNSGAPMDDKYDTSDFTARARREAVKDLRGFFILAERAIDDSGLSHEQVAHDFWLTRNGHGCGFWDRGLGATGDALTSYAKTFGTSDVMETGRGKVDLS